MEHCREARLIFGDFGIAFADVEATIQQLALPLQAHSIELRSRHTLACRRHAVVGMPQRSAGAHADEVIIAHSVASESPAGWLWYEPAAEGWADHHRRRRRDCHNPLPQCLSTLPRCNPRAGVACGGACLPTAAVPLSLRPLPLQQLLERQPQLARRCPSTPAG